MKRFKDILVARGSALSEAMGLNGSEGKKLAEKIYEETGNNYKKMHSAEDRAWFAEASKRNFNNVTQPESK